MTNRQRPVDSAVLRRTLVDLLTGENAHATAESALDHTSPRLRAVRPPRGHSVWELLEHMRIAQEDILRYTLDPKWKSPQWPKGYWPTPGSTPTPAAWRRSVAAFKRDLAETAALARNPRRDLTATIPHGEGRTYLRQILLIADHNAYHVGQIVQARKTVGDWE
jgi:DinB superfamily